MPKGLNTDVNISEFIGDLEKLENDLEVFKGRLREEMDDAVREIAEEFRDEVKAHIRASRIESDTGELMNSWKVVPKDPAHYQVRSTAGHAVYLELGTRPHEITGNPDLVFEPEPGTLDLYPDSAIMEDGWVRMNRVEHPGNDTYAYFKGAYERRNWQDKLDNKIKRRINRLVAEFAAGGR